MVSANELALAEAKKNFSSAVDGFGPLKFIREHPLASAGIALSAGVIAGLLRFPKVKTLLLSPPVIGLLKKR
ncbi:MAG: hypothetical protein KBS54_03845 [Synergistaceae bacterium]|nr:hypothetical protein [Candidatus Equadaptatus faecalis]